MQRVCSHNFVIFIFAENHSWQQQKTEPGDLKFDSLNIYINANTSFRLGVALVVSNLLILIVLLVVCFNRLLKCRKKKNRGSFTTWTNDSKSVDTTSTGASTDIIA